MKQAVSPQKLALTIKVRGRTRDSFISRYYRDVAPGGIYLRIGSVELPALGTVVRFNFRLDDGLILLAGNGVVTYVQRTADRGVGIRFDHLRIGEDVHAEMLSLHNRFKKQQREVAEEFQAAPTRPVPRIRPAVRLTH